MAKKTTKNFRKIQRKAIEYLNRTACVHTKFLIVSHPFLNNAFVYVRTKHGDKMMNILDNAKTYPMDADWVQVEDSPALDEYRRMYEEHIMKASSIDDFFMWMNRNYTIEFLNDVKDYLTPKELSASILDVWVMAGNPNINNNHEMLFDLFNRCIPKAMMDDEDYSVLSSFGDYVEVYRGVGSSNLDRVDALSWTTDIEKAKWFANRFSGDKAVYKAMIPKDHIYAYTDLRNEHEVILNYNYLEDIQEVA